jgi:DeoR family transcriptional regulator of aga operon
MESSNAPEKNSKQDVRLSLILQKLRQDGSISTEKLCQELDVSVHTIRRDLQGLEDRGLLRRTHGGAVPIEPLFYEPFKLDRSFQEQIASYAEEKRRIARAAAEMIHEGEVVALTAGTTTTEVVRSLPLGRRITVVTNTVNVAMELSQRKDLEVYVTGGHLRGDWFSLVGPAAIESISRVFVDTLFIGVNGIDAARGLTCANSYEADVNRRLVQQAKRKIVVTDHSKLGVNANWLLCELSEVDLILTDTGASDELIRPFLQTGMEVRRV